MVEDIFAQLAAIRQSLEAELKSEPGKIKRDADGIDQAPTIEPADIGTEDGLTKRNAPCPCGSGKRFKHCHGQHGPDMAVKISSVQISNVEPLSVDISPTPQISSPGESERKSFSTQGAAPRQALEAKLSEGKESKAIAMIVAGHVKLKNRRALTDVLAHRRKVLDELQAVSGISPAGVVQTVLEEIAVIEAGLEELEPPPGTLPDNE